MLFSCYTTNKVTPLPSVLQETINEVDEDGTGQLDLSEFDDEDFAGTGEVFEFDAAILRVHETQKEVERSAKALVFECSFKIRL